MAVWHKKLQNHKNHKLFKGKFIVIFYSIVITEYSYNSFELNFQIKFILELALKTQVFDNVHEFSIIM